MGPGQIAFFAALLNFPDRTMPSVMRIAVGEAQGPHRMMLNHRSIPKSAWNQGEGMSVAGWSHTMDFWAFAEPPNPKDCPHSTIRIVVGEAPNPHRAFINHPGRDQDEWNDVDNTMTFAGWDHHMEFWAFEEDVPGTIRIKVGEAQEPHRAMLAADHCDPKNDRFSRGRPNEVGSWSKFMEFYAFPQKPSQQDLKYMFEECRPPPRRSGIEGQ